MVDVSYDPLFKKRFKKIGDEKVRERVKKQIRKILSSPEIGKPMRFGRKGTRELYVAPYRLSYYYLKKENVVVLLDLYHKDEQ